MARLPTAAAPDVSIIVALTTDAPRATACLDAIAAGVGDVAAEVVLVLNGASDEMREMAIDRGREARIVDSPIDLGVPQAWREALAAAGAPRIALLHEDTEPEPGWLEPLLETMGRHPHAGVAGSRLVWPDGRHQNDGWVFWSDGHATALRGEHAQSDLAPRAVDSASGASLLADRELLERLDLPDPRWFPAIFTDADLSYSVWAAGRAVLLAPESVVRHRRGAMVQPDGPASRGPRLPEFLYARNRERFIEKWGARLAAHVDRPEGCFPDAVPAAVVDEALALADRRRRTCEIAPPPPTPIGRRPMDRGSRVLDVAPAVVERAAQLRQETQDQLVAWLSERLDRAEADVATLTAAREQERVNAEAHIAAVEAESRRAVEANVTLHAELDRVRGG